MGVLRSAPSGREGSGRSAAHRGDPFARELGSLGTGDLTVLAEIGLAWGGEGDCWVGDEFEGALWMDTEAGH